MEETVPVRKRPSPAEQARWLPQVAAGDAVDPSMQALFMNFDVGIRRYLCKRFRLDEDEAKDAWQEAVIDLWQGAARYDPSRSLAAWVVTCASNQARKLKDNAWRRRRTGLAEDSGGDADADFDDPTADAAAAALAGAAVPQLGASAGAELAVAAGAAETADAPAACNPQYRDLSAAECMDEGLKRFADDHQDDAHWIDLDMEGRSDASLAAEMGCSVYRFRKKMAELREMLKAYVGRCYDLVGAD